ncbi:hypothetical protein KR100_10145 [Synechococcus sp. KORDI-100]|uniref:Nif11-like leader peptide family natural product precursor n=1 Tax=Synechococcus sp. KORDI-100 TaxID=1280380 RepID=UPI0004E085B0|nr:Nif11-like leader peptide family natural product precursor [Synechococcus sp. KORDI-100]AII43720.1 hypothetical protein KR100_10145 [Synechococcus sp. KORDI-100]
MSEEQLKAFLEKLKADTSLQEKLNTTASAEAAIEIAKEAGFSINAEDIQSMQSGTVELSDHELEQVAGGCQVNSAKLSFPPYCEFPHVE